VRDLVVRPARPDELARAGEVAVAAYVANGWLESGDPYREHLADAPRRAREAELLVAVDADDRVIGTVTVCLANTPWSEICRPGEVEFRMLAVDPTAGGRGAGTALVAAVVRRACDLGAERVVLCSVEAMRTARRIYQRMGFMRMPDRDWSPDGRMQLLAYGLDLSKKHRCSVGV
jgi:GNAT superfamily N-acetyltransferase